VIFQILEWSILICDFNFIGTIESNPCGEAFTKHLKADDHVGDHAVFALLANPGSDAPRQEFRVPVYVRNQIKQLFGVVRHEAPFGMVRHDYCPSMIS